MTTVIIIPVALVQVKWQAVRQYKNSSAVRRFGSIRLRRIHRSPVTALGDWKKRAGGYGATGVRVNTWAWWDADWISPRRLA